MLSGGGSGGGGGAAATRRQFMVFVLARIAVTWTMVRRPRTKEALSNDKGVLRTMLP